MSKIKLDLKKSQLHQIEEKKYRNMEEKVYNKMIEGELINKSVNDYYEF